MENAAFVVDRTKLKNREDWLVTDLGAFENRGSSAHIFLINDDCAVESRFSKGTKSEKQQLQTGEYMVRNVFERHKKYNDFNHTSTLITRWDGKELPLGLIQFTFAEEEHRISSHKHPRSGKQFIPTEDVGGVLDCEQSADLPRDSKQVINARQRSQNYVAG